MDGMAIVTRGSTSAMTSRPRGRRLWLAFNGPGNTTV